MRKVMENIDPADARILVEAMMIVRDEGTRRGGEAEMLAVHICAYTIQLLDYLQDGGITDSMIDEATLKRPAA